MTDDTLQPGPTAPGPSLIPLDQPQPANLTGSAIHQVAELSRVAFKVQTLAVHDSSIRPDPIFLLAVPQGEGVVSVQGIKSLLEPYREHPERIEGTTQALTLDSFIALIDRHKSADSVVMADLLHRPPRMTAIIDYHTTDHEPRHGVHRITYDWPQSREWQAWKGKDGVAMSQSEWAMWIEDHVAELASPETDEREHFEGLFKTTFAQPADLIQLSRGLAISVDSRLKEVRALQSGESEVVYEEVHRDGSGQKLVVPGLFMIHIPLFEGATGSRLVARLRYRKKDASIVWFYQLYQADQAVQERLREDVIDVHATVDLPTYDARL